LYPEISFFGLYAPALLICAPIAYALAAGLRMTLGALGLYRFVWSRGLFNAAVFVCLLAVTLHVFSEGSL
jgi:hypothetical protein